MDNSDQSGPSFYTLFSNQVTVQNCPVIAPDTGPSLPRYVNVNSIYQSCSSLMILSVPIATWKILIDNDDRKKYRPSGLVFSRQTNAGSQWQQCLQIEAPHDLDQEEHLKEGLPDEDSLEHLNQPNKCDTISSSATVTKSLILRPSCPPENGQLLAPADHMNFSCPDNNNADGHANKTVKPEQRSNAGGLHKPCKASSTITPWSLDEEQKRRVMKDDSSCSAIEKGCAKSIWGISLG